MRDWLRCCSWPRFSLLTPASPSPSSAADASATFFRCCCSRCCCCVWLLLPGIFSLLNDYRLNAGLPPLGFVNSRLWKVGQESPGEAFVDVVGGNTSRTCDNGFLATKGWDAVTGWGTPTWPGLVKHFGY